MLIFISLLLLFLAGITACGIPKHLFDLETTLSSGKLQVWMVCIKAFGIPLSLLLLRFTKNHFVTLACFLWGLSLTFLSLLLLFDISNLAPSANIYGIVFIVAILICSISLFLFSAIELAGILKKHLPKNEAKKDQLNTSTSEEIEGTYQAPTNPSWRHNFRLRTNRHNVRVKRFYDQSWCL